MLRVLTLATLFPNEAQPAFGIFVERQTLGLAALPGVEVEVVSPRRLPPWPLTLHPAVARRAALPDREHYKGLNVHRPRFIGWPGLGHTDMPKVMARTLLPQLRRLRERFPFDVIDAEFFWPDGPAAMRLAAALGVPFSVKARGADIEHWGEQPAIARQIVAAGHAAGGLLAVSAALKARMAALGIPDDKIRVHHTGVDRAQFQPIDRAAAKARLGVDGPLLVSVGHLIPRKGQRLTLAALAEIPEATLILVGEGGDRAALERLAQEHGLVGRVRFLGGQPHAALPALLGAADVMVLPSAAEGLANVWVEALACGTPIVISDIGGAPEVVDRPAAGRIVVREPRAIAAAVREILADPPDPDRVAEAAEKFSWERNSAELFAHLSEVAAKAA